MIVSAGADGFSFLCALLLLSLRGSPTGCRGNLREVQSGTSFSEIATASLKPRNDSAHWQSQATIGSHRSSSIVGAADFITFHCLLKTFPHTLWIVKNFLWKSGSFKFQQNLLWKTGKVSTSPCGWESLDTTGFDRVFHIRIHYYCYY